jgi:urease accessory protein
MERADGASRIALACRGGRTVVADLYQRAPCRVMFPAVDHGEVLTAALVTTSGGLTGGDRLEISVTAGEGAQAVLTSQAAEKIYRSTGDLCRIKLDLTVAADAWVESLMQETILFDGARLSRRLEADVAPGGRLLAVESLVFGRSAMGETFRRGYVHDAWRIRRGGRLVWIDSLMLDGDAGAQRSLPFGLGDAAGCSTLIYAGSDASRWLGVAREAVNESGSRGGATAFDGLLVVRLLSSDAAVLRRSVAGCVARLRNEIAGLPARVPALWSF